ncbi:MAG: hypothetical protein LBR23_02645, partial [Spirochaetaceae bacterium]|nr:hypothetical protein [Spirochaetaceae bacterium]
MVMISRCALFLSILTLSGCSLSAPAPSRLALGLGDAVYPLLALNRNARTGEIASPKKSPYLYYALGETLPEELLPRVPALEVRVRLLGEAPAPGGAVILFAFLFKSDFEFRGKTWGLKKELPQRQSVRIGPSLGKDGEFALSLALPPRSVPSAPRSGDGETVAGFLLYSPVPVACDGAKIVPAEEGFDRSS